MNILYICTPSTIHDQKWMRFFADKKEFNVYAVGLNINEENLVVEFEKYNIKLLPPLYSFSIRKPLKIYLSIKKLRKYCVEYKIDFVHVLFATPHALWVNYIAIPYIITTRGSDVLVVLPQLKNQKGIKSIYFSWLFNQFKKAFAHAKFITCTSQLQKEHLKELFSVDSHIVRTGVDVDKIRMLDPDKYIPIELKEKQFIFSPRFMSPIYNIAYQIEAISYLPKSIIDNYIFVFIKGMNFNKNYFEKQLQTLQKIQGIQYLIFDYMSQEEIWATFKLSKLTIMTPISDGTPNSALEAMAAGRPLIISDLPYDMQLFENTCVKVKLNNPKLLAEQMILVLENSYEITHNAKAAVNVYGNREVEMNKLLQLYLNIFNLETVKN